MITFSCKHQHDASNGRKNKRANFVVKRRPLCACGNEKKKARWQVQVQELLLDPRLLGTLSYINDIYITECLTRAYPVLALDFQPD